MDVRVDPLTGVVDIREQPYLRALEPRLSGLGRNGVRGFLPASTQGSLDLQPNIVSYFALPENYHGKQLNSYGGYLRYNVRFEGFGRPINAPDVIITVSIVILDVASSSLVYPSYLNVK